MNFWVLFFLGVICGKLEPRIIAPLPGSFLSGKTVLTLSCQDPGAVARMQLVANDKIMFEKKGWQEQVTLDFGEPIISWRLVLKCTDRDGQVYESEAVLSKPLKIDYHETARLILVPVVVKDRKGKTVTGLTERQFEVRQDGELCDVRLLETQKVPLSIVLLVDSSSSLKQEEMILKESVLDFVDQLGPKDQSALMTFSDLPQMVFPFGAEKKEIEQRVMAIRPLGNTALFDGLLQAEQELLDVSDFRKTIVLFTDGKDSIYEEVEDKRRMLAQVISSAQNGEVAIFAIGLGMEIHKEALEFLADETGGRFVHAKTSEDLKLRFKEVLDDLKSQYVLHVDPVKSSKGYHRIEVRVKKRGTRIHARRGFTIE